MVAATAAGTALLQRGRDQRMTALASLVRDLPLDDQRCLEDAAGILEALLRPARHA
jgi:hypothetical protein